MCITYPKKKKVLVPHQCVWLWILNGLKIEVGHTSKKVKAILGTQHFSQLLIQSIVIKVTSISHGSMLQSQQVCKLSRKNVVKQRCRHGLIENVKL